MNAALLRRINLQECLQEDAASAGTPRGDPPDGSEAWTEPTLRAFYGAAPWQAPPPDAFSSWFPAAARTPPTTPPTALVIAFACAGSAEDMYTSEGTGPRRAPSPLLAWVAASGARLLAAQLPERALRRGDPAPTSAQAVAGEVLPLIAPLIAGSSEGREGGKKTPYIILGHSLGAWLAFELAAAAAAAGLPPPIRLIVSAMLAPCMDPAARPWRAQAGLDAEGLKAECRAWGISDAVFEPAVWTSYEGVLRADFRLFDEYVWRAPPPLSCPITAYYGGEDTRVSAAMVSGWAGVTAAPTRVLCARGPHLWPLRPTLKGEWLATLVAEVRGSLGV